MSAAQAAELLLAGAQGEESMGFAGWSGPTSLLCEWGPQLSLSRAAEKAVQSGQKTRGHPEVSVLVPSGSLVSPRLRQ